MLKVYCILFAGSTGLPAANFAHVVCIFYFSKLAEILPGTLDALAYADFENKYQDLLALVRYFRNEAARQVPADLKSFVPQMELIDQFDQVLFDCKLDAIKSVARRVCPAPRRAEETAVSREFSATAPGNTAQGRRVDWGALSSSSITAR